MTSNKVFIRAKMKFPGDLGKIDYKALHLTL